MTDGDKILKKEHHFGEKNIQINFDAFNLTEYKLNTDRQMPVHSHKDSYYSVIIQGEVREYILGERYIRRPGMIVFHPSDAPHSNYMISNEAVIFHIECTANSIFQSPEFHGEVQIIFEPALLRFFRNIYTQFKSAEKPHSSLSDQVYSFINESSKSNSYNRFIHRPVWFDLILEYINEHYKEVIRLDHLVKITNIHSGHLCRAFKKMTGSTINEYIHNLRIEESTRLLRNKNTTNLSSLAFELGYSDQSHFNRNFKILTGMTPLEYHAKTAC